VADELISTGGNAKSSISPPLAPATPPPIVAETGELAESVLSTGDRRVSAPGSLGSQLVSGTGGSPTVAWAALPFGSGASMARSPTAVAMPWSGSVNW
jgi:hypothetical protein